jgi:hypothetical protein
MMIIHLKRKGTLVLPFELYYRMQSIFNAHTPSLLGIKFREMIVKGGATNLGTIFSNTNMRMSKQTFPNSYIPKCTTFPKARQRAQSEPRIPNGLEVLSFLKRHVQNANELVALKDKGNWRTIPLVGIAFNDKFPTQYW